MDSTTRRTASSGTQALQRSLGILDTLSQFQKPVGLTELSDISGLAKSTTHRLLAALVEAEYVTSTEDGRYTLGPTLVRLGRAAASNDTWGTVLTESLERLSTASEDTTFYTVRRGSLAICRERQEGTGPIRNYVLHPGDRHPLGIGAGSLAILAALDPDEAEQIRMDNLAVFPADSAIARVEDDGRLDQALEQARKNGYAVNPGMLDPTSWAIAVAVLDNSGNPVGAVSIGTIEQRLGPDRIPGLVRMLRAEAEHLEHELQRKVEK